VAQGFEDFKTAFSQRTSSKGPLAGGSSGAP
jgi:hypothetical protein